MIHPVIRYQVFVSSTYEDLREERQEATQAVLEAGCFPSGMELFPASDDTQWDLIKRVIEESDYYVVIVGGRYGSVGSEGLSYTEMEYDYAVEKGIPVLGFVRRDLGEVSFEKIEQSDAGREKLQAFRAKVMKRTCRQYNTPTELGMSVLKSLMAEARVRPRTGWIRADQARSEEDVQRERALASDLRAAQQEIEKLEREVRDRTILVDEVPREKLAQGDDLVELTVMFQDETKKQVCEKIRLTWDEIFKAIGPTMYGLVVQKGGWGRNVSYDFEVNLEEFVRTKIFNRVQHRRIRLDASEIDHFVFQFKELGLVMFAELKEHDGGVFRGVQLTEHGERQLTRLSTRRREG